MTDTPIHLLRYGNICARVAHSEESVHVPVWVRQGSLDGMHALMQFCEGYQSAGHGRVPGSHELIMFFRTLRDCISKANEAAIRTEITSEAEANEP